jgi:hypothetical protein
MGLSRDRPETIRPVKHVFAVAIRPVGGDSGRWAHRHRLRQLEDAVVVGRGFAEDDTLQVLVKLLDRELDIIQRALDAGLPIFIGCDDLLELGDARA